MTADQVAQALIRMWSHAHMHPDKSIEIFHQSLEPYVLVGWSVFLPAWKIARAQHDVNMRDESFRLRWIWKAKGRSILSGCTKWVCFHCPDWPPICKALAIIRMTQHVTEKR